MGRLLPWLRSNWLRVVAHIGALLPLAALLYDNFTYNLTANPIQDIELRTGKSTLVLLVLSLVCTPLNTVLGFRDAIKVRRALGLYGFMYAGLHLFTFLVLDYSLDIKQLIPAIIEKYYVIAGFTAFVILTPIAITSTKGWIKRLGKRWKTLHKWVYIAVPVAVLHFSLSVKSIIGRPEPLIYGAIVLALLAMRLPPVRQRLSVLRTRLRSSLQAPAQVAKPAAKPAAK